MLKGKSIAGIIPARYQSQRLPGKPLSSINGKPMIYYVWKATSESEFIDYPAIATDDERIYEAVESFGGIAIMTSANHKSGTDRIYEAVQKSGQEFDIVLNIQGDEPLLTAKTIDSLINDFSGSEADCGTLIKKIETDDEIISPSVVKVAVNNSGLALYFSREPIPHIRDINKSKWHDSGLHYKHIGIYAYKMNVLKDFVNLPQSKLEKLEKLEQLRLLEAGYTFKCLEIENELIGVDTPADLEKVRKILSAQ